MNIAYTNIIIFAVIVLAAAAGIIWLQIFLSKRNSRWLGLILPVLSFILSWLPVLNIMDTGNAWQNTLLVAVTLLLYNIPTVVFLVIYAVIRERRKHKAQLEKMSIHDL